MLQTYIHLHKHDGYAHVTAHAQPSLAYPDDHWIPENSLIPGFLLPDDALACDYAAPSVRTHNDGCCSCNQRPRCKPCVMQALHVASLV